MCKRYKEVERGGLTWGLDPLVVVRVDAHLVLFEVEGILTGLNGTQLMVAVEVRPPPQATVNDVRKPLTLGDLQATVQRSGRTENRGSGRSPGSNRAWLEEGLRTLTWFGRGSCRGLMCPTVLSCSANSVPIFQSSC